MECDNFQVIREKINSVPHLGGRARQDDGLKLQELQFYTVWKITKQTLSDRRPESSYQKRKREHKKRTLHRLKTKIKNGKPSRSKLK